MHVGHKLGRQYGRLCANHEFLLNLRTDLPYINPSSSSIKMSSTFLSTFPFVLRNTIFNKISSAFAQPSSLLSVPSQILNTMGGCASRPKDLDVKAERVPEAPVSPKEVNHVSQEVKDEGVETQQAGDAPAVEKEEAAAVSAEAEKPKEEMTVATENKPEETMDKGSKEEETKVEVEESKAEEKKAEVEESKSEETKVEAVAKTED